MRAKVLTREDFVRYGRRGGKKAQGLLTKEQRKAAARRAADARWNRSMKRIDAMLGRIRKMQEESRGEIKEIRRRARALNRAIEALERRATKNKNKAFA